MKENYKFNLSKNIETGGADFLDSIGFETITIQAHLNDQILGFIKISILTDKGLDKMENKDNLEDLNSFYLNKPFVRMVEIVEQFRGKKRSIELYKKAQQYISEEYGVSLYSDSKNFIKAAATKNWHYMINMGIAKDLSDRFVLID